LAGRAHAPETESEIQILDRVPDRPITASTFHFLVILCGAPSYGVGQENEIAAQAGVPAICLVNSQVSRMMRGSFVKSYDVPYTGSLKEGVFFNEEEFTEALHAIVKIHYRHGALYSSMNGIDFGPRLKKLIDERVRDYKTFAEELGVSLDYVLAMMVEPLAVSNPSARLLERMSILLGESIGFLLGEKEKDDALYRESKDNFNAWVREAGNDVDARTANEIFDQWKVDYFGHKAEISPVSLRSEVRPMQKSRLGREVQAREIEETRVKAAIDVRHIGGGCPCWWSGSRRRRIFRSPASPKMKLLNA
jgi:hypothetical protein